MTDDSSAFPLYPKAPLAARRVMDDDERELWGRRVKDVSARNTLIEKYFPLVDVNTQNVVDTILAAIEESDFRQAAVVGFMESLDEFEPDRGLTFEDFSSLKIRAAILEELRNYIQE